MRVVRREIVSQHVISEPEPGRVLVETDLHTDMATTFTLTPLEDGQRAQLQIVTEWEARAGLLGWLEKVVTTRVLRPIYRKELRQIASYAQRHVAHTGYSVEQRS